MAEDQPKRLDTKQAEADLYQFAEQGLRELGDRNDVIVSPARY